MATILCEDLEIFDKLDNSNPLKQYVNSLSNLGNNYYIGIDLSKCKDKSCVAKLRATQDCLNVEEIKYF